MPTNKVLLSDIIKLLLATIIILLGFLLRVEKVGEPKEDMFFKKYLQESSKSTNINIHQSAKQEIENLCLQRNEICNKIHITNTEEIKQTPYTNQVYTTTNFINNNLIVGKKLIETIKKIEIKEGGENDRRGYATRDTIVLNTNIIENLKEFGNLVSHELGHIVDLGVLQGTRHTKSRTFTEFGKVVFSTNDPSLYFYQISRNSERVRKNNATKKDFCSGYGMTNPFEDFTECFNLYLNHQNFFRFIANQNKTLELKYNFIATLLQGSFIEKNTQSLSLLKDNQDRRPRDTTKL